MSNGVASAGHLGRVGDEHERRRPGRRAGGSARRRRPGTAGSAAFGGTVLPPQRKRTAWTAICAGRGLPARPGRPARPGDAGRAPGGLDGAASHGHAALLITSICGRGSAGVAHAGRDAVDRGQQGPLQRRRVGRRPPAPGAVASGGRRSARGTAAAAPPAGGAAAPGRCRGRRACGAAPAGASSSSDSPVIASTSRDASGRTPARSGRRSARSSAGTSVSHVPPGDAQVGLGQHHLHVGEERPEEVPVLVHLVQHVGQAGLAGGGQAGADAEPAGHDLPGLGPAEHPRDGPQAAQAGVGVRAASPGGSRCSARRAARSGWPPRSTPAGPGPRPARRYARERRVRRRVSIAASQRASALGGRPRRRCAAASPAARRPRSAPGSPGPGAGSVYLSEMTSPCSVTLIAPSSVPYGWARIASWVGPPPRPTVPPRPWKSRSRTPCRAATSRSARCARWIDHWVVVMPASLLESE